MTNLKKRLLNPDLIKDGTSKSVHLVKTVIRRIVDKHRQHLAEQRKICDQIEKIGTDLIVRLLGFADIREKFSLNGTPQEVSELEEIIRMIASVPTGRQILKKAAAVERPFPTQISLVPVLLVEGKKVDGIFNPENNSVEIVKIDTNIPEMSDKTRLRSRIMMAITLAHELQHSIDEQRNAQLHRLTSNKNEYVVANVLCEMSAFLSENQIGCELAYKYGLKEHVYHHPGDPKGMYRIASSATDPLYVKYKGRVALPGPPSSKQRKQAMQEALSGRTPRFKWYIHRIKQFLNKYKTFPKSTPAFKMGVEDYLKQMRIKMSFDEVMSCVSHSKKLLSRKRSRSSGGRR